MKTLKNVWKQAVSGSSQGIAYNAFTRSQVITSGILFCVISYGIALF